MKIRLILLLIISTICFRCNLICDNLEKKFSNKIVFKEFVTKITVSKRDTLKGDTIKYFIGYDKDHRKITDNNKIFYDYDKFGRLNKMYKPYRKRISCWENTSIFIFEYRNNKISKIKTIGLISKDTTILEQYFYDDQFRLIRKIKNSDTIAYKYLSNDTLPKNEIKTSLMSNIHGNKVLYKRETTFEYNKFGQKIVENWQDNDSLGMCYKYFYDNDKQLILKVDSSLNKPDTKNTYYIFWTKYRYNEKGRIIEETHFGKTLSKKEIFRSKIKFEYTEK